jgi:hypothetical protein
MSETWSETDKRTPFWWSNNATCLPDMQNPVVREVIQIKALQDAVNGDFDLINRLEFAKLFSFLTSTLLNLDEKIVGEPIFSPNKRIFGIRLFPVTSWTEDGEIYSFDEDAWAAYDMNGMLIADSGFFDCFGYASS